MPTSSRSSTCPWSLTFILLLLLELCNALYIDPYFREIRRGRRFQPRKLDLGAGGFDEAEAIGDLMTSDGSSIIEVRVAPPLGFLSRADSIEMNAGDRTVVRTDYSVSSKITEVSSAPKKSTKPFLNFPTGDRDLEQRQNEVVLDEHEAEEQEEEAVEAAADFVIKKIPKSNVDEVVMEEQPQPTKEALVKNEVDDAGVVVSIKKQKKDDKTNVYVIKKKRKVFKDFEKLHTSTTTSKPTTTTASSTSTRIWLPTISSTAEAKTTMSKSEKDLLKEKIKKLINSIDPRPRTTTTAASSSSSSGTSTASTTTTERSTRVTRSTSKYNAETTPATTPKTDLFDFIKEDLDTDIMTAEETTLRFEHLPTPVPLIGGEPFYGIFPSVPLEVKKEQPRVGSTTEAAAKDLFSPTDDIGIEETTQQAMPRSLRLFGPSRRKRKNKPKPPKLPKLIAVPVKPKDRIPPFQIEHHNPIVIHPVSDKSKKVKPSHIRLYYKKFNKIKPGKKRRPPPPPPLPPRNKIPPPPPVPPAPATTTPSPPSIYSGLGSNPHDFLKVEYVVEDSENNKYTIADNLKVEYFDNTNDDNHDGKKPFSPNPLFDDSYLPLNPIIPRDAPRPKPRQPRPQLQPKKRESVNSKPKVENSGDFDSANVPPFDVVQPQLGIPEFPPQPSLISNFHGNFGDKILDENPLVTSTLRTRYPEVTTSRPYRPPPPTTTRTTTTPRPYVPQEPKSNIREPVSPPVMITDNKWHPVLSPIASQDAKPEAARPTYPPTTSTPIVTKPASIVELANQKTLDDFLGTSDQDVSKLLVHDPYDNDNNGDDGSPENFDKVTYDLLEEINVGSDPDDAHQAPRGDVRRQVGSSGFMQSSPSGGSFFSPNYNYDFSARSFPTQPRPRGQPDRAQEKRGRGLDIVGHISSYGKPGLRDDLTDFGAASGSNGAFGWYSDHPVGGFIHEGLFAR